MRAVFTTGLDAQGLAAAEVAGLRPLEQVTGACVLRTQFYASPQGLGMARRQALRRLEQHARDCGADAVACVQVTHTERVAGESAQRDGVLVEAVATGMAVSWPGGASGRGDPVLTTMNVQECWKLAQGGYAPAGIVMSTIADAGSLSGMPSGGGGSVGGTNYEYADVSAMFRSSYRRAAQDMRQQAAALGAEGVIAAQLNRRMTWAGLYVRIILTVTGTAIVSVRDDGDGDGDGKAGGGAGPGADAGRSRLTIRPVRRVGDPS